MCVMSFVKDTLSIFFGGFNQKWTQQFPEKKTMPSVSNFMWLLVLSNVISEILSKENYVKPQTSPQCQRIIRKETALCSLTISSQQPSSIGHFSLSGSDSCSDQYNSVDYVYPIHFAIAHTIYDVCHYVSRCLLISRKWYLHQLDFSHCRSLWHGLQAPKAIQSRLGLSAQENKSLQPCSKLHICSQYALNTGQKLIVLIIYFTLITPIEV